MKRKASSHKTAGVGVLVPPGRIDQAILRIRGQRVMLDADLAALYGVPTMAFNQAVKRNKGRFPPDFRFELTKDEKAEVITNRDDLGRLKFSRTLPWAFTEHGAIMAANVLNSERAVQVSVLVVRAFIRMRQLLESQDALARKLVALEKKYDARFKVVFDAIRQLMEPAKPVKTPMGFRAVRDQRASSKKKPGE